MPDHHKTSSSAVTSKPASEEANGLDIVLAYHERTKHHYHRYAASLGYLDWATQPDPFRRYAGAKVVRLPQLPAGNPLPYASLYEPGQVPAQPLSLASVAQLFRYALSLTAWKRIQDSSWSLRANPSSGNLHPTEGYAVLPAIAGVGDAPGVYHYAPREHALEHRAVTTPDLWNQLVPPKESASFLVGLSSIHWREAWKYGERAFRYCQHDVGHALAALRIAAATLGWQLSLIASASDDAIATLLGLDRLQDYDEAEVEEPDLLAVVHTSRREDLGASAVPPPLPSLAQVEAGLSWTGKANKLSPEHAADWPVIDAVSSATRRTQGLLVGETLSSFPARRELFPGTCDQSTFSAEKVILGRRSAVAMDGVTSISSTTFLHMLARLLPLADGSAMPWDAIPWRPRIHLLLFVHRVVGLPSGLYMLVRDPQRLAALQADLRNDFLWQAPESVAPALPLYMLAQGDYRDLAARLACGQEIAADGAFSLAMIADYTRSLDTYGPSFYRNLFWEAGMVGQVLYLEAEDAGIRATGIGCYFDDPVHELLGLRSRQWQSLYHFTVGGPIDDPRLTTFPPYPEA